MNETVPSEHCRPVGSARQLHFQQIVAGLCLSFTFVALLGRRRPGAAATERVAVYGHT